MSSNERLAAAIVAMYKTLDGHEWDATSELIQSKSFELWNAMTWTSEAMALYLWQHGWDEDDATNFTDISLSRFWAVVREHVAEMSTTQSVQP